MAIISGKTVYKILDKDIHYTVTKSSDNIAFLLIAEIDNDDIISLRMSESELIDFLPILDTHKLKKL